jgi:hypothetical protein
LPLDGVPGKRRLQPTPRRRIEDDDDDDDEDEDEYPGKPWLFWVRHGHYRDLTYSRQNSRSCKLLTASEILPVTMGRTNPRFASPVPVVAKAGAFAYDGLN